MSTSGRRPITVAAVIALSSATGAGVVVASSYHHHRAAVPPVASVIGPSSSGSSEASASAAPLAELELARPVASSPPPPPLTPSVVFKTNAVSWPADTDKDALDAAALTPVVKTAYPALDECRIAAIGRNPNLQGKTKTRLLIERDGHVSAVRDGGSDVPDPVARKCVEDALAKLVFPPANGRTVAIIPVKFALR